jgi:hypothetical protein
VTVLASIRPDSFGFPLFLHVFGAMVLVGATAAAVTAGLAASRSPAPDRLRLLAARVLFLGSLPAYIVMRVGAEWIHSKEFPKGVEDPDWVGVGYITADGGGILLVVALILAGWAVRARKPRLSLAGTVLAGVALVAWLVAVWAMGAKPS